MESFEGELHAGEAFRKPIGNALDLWFQPTASGWILRVVPAAGAPAAQDYAELATPPYRSVSPLSISTDFAFRAQDAVGWNPRHFRFATTPADFARLEILYHRTLEAADAASPGLETELSAQLAAAAEGTLTLLDARLIPGVADQWRMAAAVASHFNATAHTLADPPDGRPEPLGKLLWIRFRVDLTLPPAFLAPGGVHLVPHLCSTP